MQTHTWAPIRARGPIRPQSGAQTRPARLLFCPLSPVLGNAQNPKPRIRETGRALCRLTPGSGFDRYLCLPRCRDSHSVARMLPGKKCAAGDLESPAAHFFPGSGRAAERESLVLGKHGHLSNPELGVRRHKARPISRVLGSGFWALPRTGDNGRKKEARGPVLCPALRPYGASDPHGCPRVGLHRYLINPKGG